MKSIKPGRGPSMMGGVSCIATAVFGILWMVCVYSAGGGVFALFGLVFVILAVANAVYHFRNATSKDRYSAFDITDSTEETDPLNERFGRQAKENEPFTVGNESRFCPYCGAPAEQDFEYCNKCGKELP